MNQDKKSLTEIANNLDAVKTARSEPIQQQEPPRQSMDFIRSLMLDIPVQALREPPVSESMNIERLLHAQMEAKIKESEKEPTDHISLDIPLLIRVFELVREGVKSDIEVHSIVERMLAIKDKGVLTMDDYQVIAGGNINGTDKEHAPQAFSGEPQNESLAFLKKLAGIR
jgi:hypothetical protein